jgi:squalene-hopene/tetraprenyl-beta-curcumene cyclase
MTVTASPRLGSARRALERGRDRLLSLQDADGWWKGELETNVTIDSEDLFLRFHLGILDSRVTEPTARWIRSKQRGDGSWATFFGGPPDVSTTVEAYVALRLAGDAPESDHMRRASACVRELGGVETTRVFTRMWLALLGLWAWDEVPVIPPEQILFPPRVPLSVYSFGCWARQTIVALSVCCALRPVTPVPFLVDELLTGVAPKLPATDIWSRTFSVVDRALHRYERRPIEPLRRRSLAAAERWIVERQERDGSWGGIQPPWVWSIVALRALGYPIDHPVLSLAFAGLDSFTVEDEAGRRVEACQSPVWDTALATIALLDAGLPPGHDAIEKAALWLADREVVVRGDWSVRRPKLPAGGFSFEFANDNYPDVDDTSVVVLALRLAAGDRFEGPCERGLTWAMGMQSRDGGWGAFDVENTSSISTRLPFCDFGSVTDPPSADVTAHMVELLAREDRLDGARAAALRAGVDFLLRSQEADGSWFGRWGANYVYGVGSVVPALAACGLAGHESVRRAITWLEGVQNDDGGFGEDLRSYRDPDWRGRGASTASQTAWALLAFDAAGEDCHAVERAVGWLVDSQRPDGGWDEPYYTGTGFPGDFYLNYHLYRQVFPVTALGRILREER